MKRASGRGLQVAKAAAAGFALTLGTSACTTLAGWWLGPPAIRRCPGELVATTDLASELRFQERVRYSRTGDEAVQGAFTLVVERSAGGEALVLVGLNEFGAKAFALTQHGRTVEVESQAPGLFVEPQVVLRDLHRLRLGAPLGPDALRSEKGERSVLVDTRCGYATSWLRVTKRED